MFESHRRLRPKGIPMFQASSLLVNTELFGIPSSTLWEFGETALKLGAFAFVLFTSLSLVSFHDKNETFLENLKGASVIGFLAFELALGTTFFMQAVMFTHGTTWLPALIVGFVNTLVFNAAVIIVSLVIYFTAWLMRTANEFFHRHPIHLG